MLYPMNMEMKGRKCIVLGGGPVALRKVCSLLEAGAEVSIISPALRPELRELCDGGYAKWVQRSYRQGDLRGSFLVICATDRSEVNCEAAEEAKRLGVLVNAPAQPELSDFTVPAVVRRGKLLLSVSTGNVSPAFSRLIREHLEDEFSAAFGDWLERLHVLRREVKEKLDGPRAREKFWRASMDAHILEFVRNGQLARAEVELRNAIDSDWTES